MLLVSRKSYLVIMYPNSHKTLSTVNIDQVGVGVNIAQNYSFNFYEIISENLFAPIHINSWQKVVN